MAYINALLPHFRVINEWGTRMRADIRLDVISFQLEVRCRNRYYSLYPQFFSSVNGVSANTQSMTPSTIGFTGWLPYPPLSFDLSRDKLQFKQLIQSAGLRTPAKWNVDDSAAPDADYVLKRSAGSFGNELSGPFRAKSSPTRQPQPQGQHQGELFAEEYVHGRALKVWCWGRRPFFAHVRSPKTVVGDGTSTVRQLTEAYLAKLGKSLDGYREHHVLRDCLAYQGLGFDDVPSAGASTLIDYRYGRDGWIRNTNLSDNEFSSLSPRASAAIDTAAQVVATALRATLPAPVLYSLDAVVDENDDVWWLEVNSNPTMPPEGYSEMFLDLFGS